MRRRDFITLLGGAAAWPLTARAQQKVHRVGFLGNSTPTLEADLITPFRNGLRGLGYEEGRNIVVEYRWAEGRYERFPTLIAELIAAKVEVMVTAGTPATLAVKNATTSIPLVMIAVGDPISTGIVPNLRQPGGNITGLTSIAPELEAKRLELLKEAVPRLSHFAVLWNPSNAYQVLSENEIRALALVLGLKMLSLRARNEEEIEQAFATVVRERPDAMLVLADRLFLHNRMRIMEFALKHRLPGVHAYRELVEAGGLMSYGPSYADLHRRAASYVDKILKGTKPGDLPVELPTKFDLIINLKTAKAFGLDMPPTLLARADEVIE
jgi:putative tryptophan/tyrosine transport system substrate-binding protein